MSDTDPYEDDGEGYGTTVRRGSDGITTTYGGWLTMLRIALVYGWLPEGGSYSYNGGRRPRLVSYADATNMRLALDRYVSAPHEAYARWLVYVSGPKEQQARIVPMGEDAHWKEISSGGAHSAFARNLSDFCAGGAFEI